jgi:hypothetical protein
LVLAAVLSVTDAVRQMFDFSRPDDTDVSGWPVGWAIFGRVLSVLLFFVAFTNIVLNMGALVTALGSIELQYNYIDPGTVISQA